MTEALKSIFFKQLRARRLKLTAQRESVLKKVLAADGHFGAEELYMSLGGLSAKVSRATVYRTLELLVDCGIVQKMRFGEDYFRFERSAFGKHHDHLVCVKCGQVIEFFSAKIERLQNNICKDVSFVAEGHSLIIFGICNRCRGSVRGELPGENEKIS